MTAIYQLKNLRYGYAGQPVLNIKHLMIAANKVTAIVGANGAGKSTLFDILALLQPATSDEFLFSGTALADARRAEFRQQIGYVQQRPYLMAMSVRANIGLGLKFRRWPRAAIDRAVDSIAAELGLQPLLARPARRLSGGEVQKVALARALVLQPAVMIMDEPFAYLDAQTEADMQHWIARQKVRAERTLIFSTHDQLKAQAIAEHVVGIINGDVHAAACSNVFQGLR